MRRSAESMQAEIEELKEKCKKLEDSRENLFETNKTMLRDLRKKNEQTEKGAQQVHDICNSVLKYVAWKNGGSIEIPKNHMELTKDWGFVCEVTEDDYIYRMKGEEE